MPSLAKRPRFCKSMHARAAVDDQRLTGDEIALGRGEEDDRADQILRLLHALKRPLPGGGGAHPDDALARILLRQRAARRDAVHADAVLAELARERASEAQHARFRGDIVDAARRALQRGARADVDDLAVAALAHVRDHGARGEPGAAQVDRHHAVPFPISISSKGERDIGTLARSATSVRTAIASKPWRFKSAASASAALPSISAITTFAPSLANPSA